MGAEAVMRLMALLFMWTATLPAACSLGRGFEYFYNLDYEEAIAAFQKEIAADPENPEGYNHLAQALLYREMYRSGALESELVTGNNPFLGKEKVVPPPDVRLRFDSAVEKSMALSKARMAENPKDLNAIYLLGIAHGLQANYKFLILKEWGDALKEFTQARRLQNQVTESDPSFVDAYLIEGVHDYVVGSLPFTWKMLGFMVGFRGDKDGGIRTVEMVAQKGSCNRIDAMIALAVAYRREREPAKAIPLLERLIQLYPRNYLFRLGLAQMYGDFGDKEKALAVLNRMEEMKKRRAPGSQKFSWAKVAFARGTVLFWYRDYDEALTNLSTATAAGEELDLNAAAYAWLRVGQIHDIRDQRTAAKEAYRRTITTAPDSDAAKEARRYLSSPYRRKD